MPVELIYCPKCGSRLFECDTEYILVTGVCSYCVCYDTTSDRRYRKKWEASKKEVKL